MSTRRLTRAAVTLAVALVPTLALSACGEEHAAGEPLREGLALPLEGITYDVFITRQLNLQDVEDMGYVRDVPDAPPGSTYYGVFLEACNFTEEERRTASSFKVVDTTGEEFAPIHLDPENPFSYSATLLEPEDCIPAEGSVAASGPTSGALLMFEIPLEASENRPLELVVSDGFDLAEGAPHELLIELDI